ncbi:MAG TPA: Mur ligase domain-containing protein, partial [Xanthobacteraceae bacterium]|nr:Mur ligase domain-containing protein [Xanthobacteraceae bacterium]
MSLAEAAAAMQARVVGADGRAEIRFDGVSTDTRTAGKGQLFVAIRGERHDGHDFLAAARDRGAAAALVDERHATALSHKRHQSALSHERHEGAAAPLPLLVADDTRLALGRLGRHWRLRFAPALIAITGSNGKTTTKEMLASILRRHAGESGVLATRGNLNTEIGVPLTLLGLR